MSHDVERGLHRRHQLLHGAAGLGRDVHPRRPRQLGQLQIDLAVQQKAPVLVDQIPFVERQHQRPARLDHHRQHPLVLLGQRLGGVDQHHHHLGGVDRAVRAHRGVELMPAGLADLAPQPGGVDETPSPAAQFDQRVHRVDGRAGDIVHHRPLGTGQPVEQ